MKIAKIESFICDAGWRPWVFVKVETDDGLVGWGECSDGWMPRSVAAAVDDFGGRADRAGCAAVEKAYWTMYRSPASTSGDRRAGRRRASSWRSGTSRRGTRRLGLRAEGRPDARADPPLLVALWDDAAGCQGAGA